MQEVKLTGISTLALYAIPLVLALAAGAWLTFFDGARILKRTMSQEKRHAIFVGASTLPKEPLKIKISSRRDDALQIDKVDIDGGKVWVYYHNAGVSGNDFDQYSWKLIAPDGTIVKSASHYISGAVVGPGEKAELKLEIDTDPRAVIFDIRMSGR